MADTFPASVTSATWTCIGAGGGSCGQSSGTGNINAADDLPAGGSVTYTATAAISPSATGVLSNTATVDAGSVFEIDPRDNTDTDTDTLSPSADLSISKDDGVTTATPGGSVTYTIIASNNGPSDAPGATVADTFPASETATWTCAGAHGGSCRGLDSGSGNINASVDLPSGGSVTYRRRVGEIEREGHTEQHGHGERAGRRGRGSPSGQRRHRHRHALAVGRPVDHEDRRGHLDDGGRVGDLHDHRFEQRALRRPRRDGGRRVPGRGDRDLGLRRRRWRVLRSELRVGEHQRAGRSARRALLPELLGGRRHLAGERVADALGAQGDDLEPRVRRRGAPPSDTGSAASARRARHACGST